MPAYFHESHSGFNLFDHMTAELDQARQVKYDAPDVDEVRLKDIVWHDGQVIRECAPIILDRDNRLYFKSMQPHSFDFAAVSFVSVPSLHGDYWTHDELEVSVYCHGVACFEGVRHLWMPYVNYPNVDILAKLMQELAKLEDQFCTSPSRKD